MLELRLPHACTCGQGPPLYACERGYCVARGRADVDALVTGVVIARLARPDAIELFAPDANHQALKAREDAAITRGRLDVAADQFAGGILDGVQLARITARLRPELDRLERVARSSVSPTFADLARPDVASVWDTVPLSRRRLIIDTLLEIRILPVGKRGPVPFDPTGIEITWKAI